MALRRKTATKPVDDEIDGAGDEQNVPRPSDRDSASTSRTASLRAPRRASRAPLTKRSNRRISQAKPHLSSAKASTTSSKVPGEVPDAECDAILTELLTPVPTSVGAADIDPTARTKVKSAIGNLGSLESEVIAALFPSNGAAPESLESIGHRLGMTLEEVQGIADNALRGLRGSRSGTRISTVWN